MSLLLSRLLWSQASKIYETKENCRLQRMNINWIVIALNLLLSLLLAWLAALYSRSTLMSVYSVSTTQRSKNQTTMNGSVKKATQTHTRTKCEREITNNASNNTRAQRNSHHTHRRHIYGMRRVVASLYIRDVYVSFYLRLCECVCLCELATVRMHCSSNTNDE